MQLFLNPGPLTSNGNLAYHLGPQLDRLDQVYREGLTPQLVLDLRHIEYGTANITALATLLSICRKISTFIRQPIYTEFSWNHQLQSYLHHIDFFKIAQHRQILRWKQESVGGFGRVEIHPGTKIIEYGDIQEDLVGVDAETIFERKAYLKQKIGPNFRLRCQDALGRIDPHIREVLINTALELITNSLIHAQDFAFVAIRKSSRKATISVSDSGIGFRKSLSNSFPDVPYFRTLSNVQSIVIGSLVQKKQHGLRLAISDVLGNFQSIDNTNEGWVSISTFDSEVRWQKSNWKRALDFYEHRQIEITPPDIEQILGKDATEKLSPEEANRGYWRKTKGQLVGTRVSFELPLA